MDPASEPFLRAKEEEDHDDAEGRPESAAKPATPWRSARWIVAAHLGLMVLYGLISWIGVQVYLDRHLSQQHAMEPAMADLNVKWEPKLLRNMTGNIYAGPAPNASIDQAWEDLLYPINMRASKAELDHDHQESVALTENGGYLVWLGVFHELHCVKMLRQWVYRDHYHPNLTEEEESHWFVHADHCLDVLRQASACHGDLSLTVFKWDPQKRKPLFDAAEAKHECINWDALMESTAHRFVSDEEIGRLQNPLLEKGGKNGGNKGG